MAEAVLAWQTWWGGIVRPDVRRWATPSVVLGFATLAIHLLVNGRYGFFATNSISLSAASIRPGAMSISRLWCR